MIKNTSKLDICSALEQWGYDDLNLLEEFGASEFSTPHLIHLRVQLTDKLLIVSRRYNFMVLALLCSFGWALFGTGMLLIGFKSLVYPVFGLFGLCTLISAGGLFIINKTSEGGKLKESLYAVESELELRKEVFVENDYFA